jgi:dephospho-CoA kinase
MTGFLAPHLAPHGSPGLVAQRATPQTSFVRVTVVLVTGMSGTGKSTALVELARRGHRVVDTDYGDWTQDAPSADREGTERLWREDRIDTLLEEHDGGVLFVSGCVANQGSFYPRFDAIVLLSAPADVILGRVATRDTNDYGKTEEQRDLIVHHLATVEPLLRAGATTEIDTRASRTEVVDALERIAGSVHRQTG